MFSASDLYITLEHECIVDLKTALGTWKRGCKRENI